ncbi:unnamed protein product [Paramecium octaurelia]|uniref:Uncharacterized protein n=1 Tax=Paramecium octaurelia TaxID=43137 RepID=A0A8S1XPW8_PAROT|nr:unnamed protein product [Paramecium octaurelia]
MMKSLQTLPSLYNKIIQSLSDRKFRSCCLDLRIRIQQ